jgi:hypothetical protein
MVSITGTQTKEPERQLVAAILIVQTPRQELAEHDVASNACGYP